MRTLYESILDLDNEKEVDKRVQLDTYRQLIFENCGCFPDESKIEIDGKKIYLDLRFHNKIIDCYPEQLASDRGFKCLTDIMKSFDIYYCLYGGRAGDFLRLSVFDTNKTSWNDAINNAIKLFSNTKWHFCGSDHSEISGKFDCLYEDYTFIKDGEERDYKELCKWFDMNSNKPLNIRVKSSTNPGTATCKNVNTTAFSYEYGQSVIDLKDSKVDELNVGPVSSAAGAFGSGTVFHNVKAKKLTISSDGYYIDKAARCILNNIDLKAYETRDYSNTAGLNRLKTIINLEHETIRDNLKALGDPEVIIKISSSRLSKTFVLKEYRKSYILKRV